MIIALTLYFSGLLLVAIWGHEERVRNKDLKIPTVIAASILWPLLAPCYAIYCVFVKIVDYYKCQ